MNKEKQIKITKTNNKKCISLPAAIHIWGMVVELFSPLREHTFYGNHIAILNKERKSFLLCEASGVSLILCPCFLLHFVFVYRTK